MHISVKLLVTFFSKNTVFEDIFFGEAIESILQILPDFPREIVMVIMEYARYDGYDDLPPKHLWKNEKWLGLTKEFLQNCASKDDRQKRDISYSPFYFECAPTRHACKTWLQYFELKHLKMKRDG